MQTYNRFLLRKNHPINHAIIKNDGKIISTKISLIGKKIDTKFGPRMQTGGKLL